MPFRRAWPMLALAAGLGLSACLPVGQGLDFAVRSDDGWVGLPIEELLLRPTIEARLLAVCFDASCPEPAAVLSLSASGKDARELQASFDDPSLLASLLNRADAEDKSKPRRDIRTNASARRLDVAGLPAFMLSLERADRPDRTVHAVAVGRRNGNRLDVVLSIARRQDVALANAGSAAMDMLYGSAGPEDGGRG